ncbi:capsid assembly scaffolding protein Gp46 family protein [Lactiplantibacillus daowaiensis]|uniref:DUF4355 domain-containing protein n=1 Tax=Lactiplantibacillus daowaiensis TaxID=2559918 RepID=A0ABW1RXT9_9LACO|nr:DUF4355 domain-containing protein [Lactiplantibacillus daowaiensis]
MKLNLQFFADPDDKKGEEKKPKAKAYTQEDVNKMMAAKASEVAKAHEDKWSKQADDLKAKYLREGEERAKMSADDKAKAELADRLKALDDKQAELDKRDAEQKREAALNATRTLLVNEGLPANFAAQLTADDEPTRMSNVTAFAKTFKSAVDSEISDRAKGKVNPQTGAPAGGNSKVTQEEFDRMGMEQRMALYKEDKATYEKLKGSNN